MNEREKEQWLDQWLTTQEVAAEFGITTITQNGIRHRRQVEYTKAGGLVRYKRRWVLNYFDKKRVEAAQ
jgi:hypothetical protein